MGYGRRERTHELEISSESDGAIHVILDPINECL